MSSTKDHSEPSSSQNVINNERLIDNGYLYSNYRPDVNKSILDPHQKIVLPMTICQQQTASENSYYTNQSLQHTLDVCHELNQHVIPRLTAQMKIINKSHGDIQRVQGKLMDVFTRLRKMRRSLIAAGVVLEGELDPVEESKRRDAEELEKARQAFVERKRLEQLQQKQQEESQKGNNIHDINQKPENVNNEKQTLGDANSQTPENQQQQQQQSYELTSDRDVS
eukprot:UN01929